MLTVGVCRRCKGVLKISIFPLAIKLQIYISIYTLLKIQFRQQSLPKFWLSIASECPLLSQNEVRMLQGSPCGVMAKVLDCAL